MKSNVKISIVIPCYRSEHSISEVVADIMDTMATRPKIPFEALLVNDGSPDRTFDVISAIARRNDHVKAINLSKNFGQHCVLMAAYSQVTGDYIVGMDDDLEHDPHDMFKLIDELEKGYDYVCAAFTGNDHSLYKRIGSKINDWMATNFIGKPREALFSSYYVMRRYVVNEIVKTHNPNPYVGGMIVSITKKLSFVPIEHHSRTAGSSGYNLRNSLGLWVNGITAFSVKPLRIASYAGMLFSIFGFLFGLFVVIRKLIYPQILAGYSSTIALLALIGGIIMVTLGIIGEYIGRIYRLINSIPQYVIREIVTSETPDAEEATREESQETEKITA